MDKLTQDTFEQYRLLDPDGQAAKVFQVYIEGIQAKLLKPYPEASRLQFRYMVSDSDERGASIITGFNPPIVMFTKGMIRQLQNEDQYAAVLGHEFTHQEIFQRIGMHKSSNPEEASGDVWSVFALHKAGYRPKAMLEILDMFDEPRYGSFLEKAIEAVERAVKVPHPPMPVRKRNVENALAVLEQKTALKETPTVVSADNQRVFLSERHIGYVETVLARDSYKSLSVPEKMVYLEKMLFAEFNALSNWRSKDEIHKVRVEDIRRELGRLQHERSAQASLPAIADKLKKYSSNSYTISRCVSETLSSWGEDRNDELDILHNSVSSFVNAETKEEALKVANQINAIIEKYPFEHTWSYVRIRAGKWPKFSCPSKYKLADTVDWTGYALLPWHRHAQWGRRDKESQTILLALHRLGVEDPRIPSNYTKVKKVIHETTLFNKPFDPADIILDAGGRVIGFHSLRANRFVRFKNLSELQQGERLYLSGLQKREELALESVDWQLLETDFLAFASQYHEMLRPDYVAADGFYPFAEKFIEKITDLLEKKPCAYKNIVHQFFIGNEGKGLLARFNTQLERKYTVVAALEQCRRSYGDSVTLQEKTDKIFPRMGDNHPYIKFIMADKAGIFTPKDKVQLVSYTDYWSPRHTDKPEELLSMNHRGVLGYNAPQTAEELYQALEKISALQKQDNMHDLAREYLDTVKSIELYAYLRLGRNECLDFQKVSFYTPLKLSLSEAYGSSIQKAHQKKFGNLIDQQCSVNIDRELNGNIGLDELVSSYFFYAKQDKSGLPLLLSRPDLVEKLEDKIIGRVNALDDRGHKIRIIERILIEGNPKNPEFRNWAIDTWAQETAEKIDSKTGILKSKSGYIKTIAREVMSKTNLAQSLFMLSELLDRTQAQEDESFYVRDLLLNAALAQGAGQTTHLMATANDLILESLGDNRNVRHETLSFLLDPYKEDGAKSLMWAIQDSYDKTELSKFIQDKGYDGYIDLIPEAAKIHRLKMLHLNFWSLPFAARTIYLERILFPLNGNNYDFERAAAFVMDRVMPQGQKYAGEARKILNAYMATVSRPLQRLILSALMTANDVSNREGRMLRPGQVLSMVLGQSGPAGTKILQAIHSHDSTPEDIREDVKGSKNDINKPFRWNIFERMNEAMPSPARKSISKVCACLGSGAYGYTVRAIRNFRESAITLLRPDVEHEARYQFEKFRLTAETMAKDDPSWEPLIDILAHARDMAVVEANFEIAAEQIKQAGKHYDGLSVTVNGYTFDFSAASLLSHGMEYKETTLAKGVHFNDLSAKTLETKEFKKAAAQALFTVELYIICKGFPLDHDRHGAQQRIEGKKITVFDHGAMMFDKNGMVPQYPEEKEKKVLGTVLAHTCNQVLLHHAPVVETLMENLKSAEKELRSPAYIHAFKRAVLAMNDFRRVMGDTDEERNQKVMEVIQAIAMTGNIDKTIAAAVLENINPSINLMKSAGSTGSSIIIIDRSEFVLKRLFKRVAIGMYLAHDKRKTSPTATTEDRTLRM